MLGLQYQMTGQSLFRFLFPASGETDGLWRISQAADDPEFLVDAETIWNHPVERWVTRARIIEQPQALLRGLGAGF